MASIRGEIGSSNISTIMSGIRAWHIAQDVVWNGDPTHDALIKGVRHAVSSSAPSSTVRPLRDPVSLEHLCLLHRGLDITRSMDAAVYAVACCAFWGVCRLGELTVSSRNETAIESAKRVRRDPLPSFTYDDASSSCAAEFRIPWTKTTKHVGATIVLTHIDGSQGTSPVDALRNHLHINNSFSGQAHLFAYLDPKSDTVVPMVKKTFMARCNVVWKQAGLSPLTGHSFRIGGCTELLLRGVSHEWVKIQGRWLSDAWMTYIRGTPVLLQNEMRKLQAASQVSEVNVQSDVISPVASLAASVSNPAFFSIGL